jgi:hypothetical protein
MINVVLSYTQPTTDIGARRTGEYVPEAHHKDTWMPHQLLLLHRSGSVH